MPSTSCRPYARPSERPSPEEEPLTPSQTASVVVSLAILLAAAHLIGHAFERLRQPRLVGEIVAGALVGPHVLGRVAPGASSALLGDGATPEAGATRIVIGFAYWLGLLLPMFVSGSEVRRVLAAEDRRPTAWILGVGTPVPFLVALLVGALLPLRAIAGPAGEPASVLLVLATAVAVTSIPVISRIFHDLRILHTRFASLVLGAALLEDIALRAVMAVATVLPVGGLRERVAGSIARHVGVTAGSMGFGLWVAPAVLRRLHETRWNVLRTASPLGYAVLVLLAYTAAAALLEVNLVFAAFLAGSGPIGGMRGTHRRLFAEQLDAIAKVAFAVFIPLSFAVVGSQVDATGGASSDRREGAS